MTKTCALCGREHRIGTETEYREWEVDGGVSGFVTQVEPVCLRCEVGLALWTVGHAFRVVRFMLFSRPRISLRSRFSSAFWRMAWHFVR